MAAAAASPPPPSEAVSWAFHTLEAASEEATRKESKHPAPYEPNGPIQLLRRRKAAKTYYLHGLTDPEIHASKDRWSENLQEQYPPWGCYTDAKTGTDAIRVIGIDQIHPFASDEARRAKGMLEVAVARTMETTSMKPSELRAIENWSEAHLESLRSWCHKKNPNNPTKDNTQWKYFMDPLSTYCPFARSTVSTPAKTKAPTEAEFKAPVTPPPPPPSANSSS